MKEQSYEREWLKGGYRQSYTLLIERHNLRENLILIRNHILRKKNHFDYKCIFIQDISFNFFVLA